MPKKKPYLLVYMLLVALSSYAAMPAAKYVQWVNDSTNGLKRDTIAGSYTFSLQYLPAEMMLLRDRTDNNALNRKQQKTLLSDYTEMQYYVLPRWRRRAVCANQNKQIRTSVC